MQLRRGLLIAGILSCVSFCGAQESRGLKSVFRDSRGKIVGEYAGSYALLIGVSDYSAGWPDLESVPEELTSVKRLLEERGFAVRMVLDPTGEGMIRAFEAFVDSFGYEPDNRLLFFFAGHGHSRREGRKGYLVPADAPLPSRDETGFLQRAVSMNRVRNWAEELEVKHALFLFDSGFSGTIFKTRAGENRPEYISALTALPVREFITAGSAGEEVPAKSIFIPSFVRALRGVGDYNRDGYVTGTELGMFLHDQVVSYGMGQTPQYGKILNPELDQGDFVFEISAPPMVSGGKAPPPPEPVRMGHLQVNVNVGDSRIYVDGKYRGSADPGRPLNLSDVGLGEVEVKGEAEGYEAAIERVDLAAGEWRQAVLTLDRSLPVAPAEEGGSDW